jgi:hypothetical protein
MTRLGLRPWISVVLMGVLGLGLSVAIATPAGAAGSGYTPPSPPPSNPPTPTTCPAGNVITSLTIPPGGGSVSATVDGSTVTVTVPAGSFPDGAQVAIVEFSAAVAPTGDSIVLAFGIDFCVNGAKYQGTFSPGATVTVANPAIRPGQTLYQQIGTTLVPLTAQISNGSLSFSIDTDPNFVLVAAVGPAATIIPGATNVVTGKPFLLEELVGGLLVLVGSTLLFLRLRLRRR